MKGMSKREMGITHPLKSAEQFSLTMKLNAYIEAKTSATVQTIKNLF